MVTTTDIGEKDNVHPVGKKRIAERLFLAAKSAVYGDGGEYCGPLFSNACADEAGVVKVEFTHADDGLMCDGDVSELYICGSDMDYKPAKSRIDGNCLIVWNDEITKPVSVKMAYVNYPEINLYNKNGFIAAPFCWNTAE